MIENPKPLEKLSSPLQFIKKSRRVVRHSLIHESLTITLSLTAKTHSPHSLKLTHRTRVKQCLQVTCEKLHLRLSHLVLALLLLPDSDGDRTHIYVPTKHPHINSKRLPYKIAFDRFLRFSEPANAPNPTSSNSSSLSKIAIEHNLQIAKILR